jgi:tetratricopeptide (TPR) repeat protein
LRHRAVALRWHALARASVRAGGTAGGAAPWHRRRDRGSIRAMAVESAPTLPPEAVIGHRYVIRRLIGRGGMGEVYAAARPHLGDEVALKRLLPSQDTVANRQRFAIEAQAAAHIRHPNVVRLFDYGVDDTIGPYLVMELLEGPTLAAIHDAGRLPLAQALELFTGICAAVEAGHRRGIVHRDLKPANVIVTTADDGRQLVKVLDFGLAVDQRIADRGITTPGTMIGTVAYMAPEQTDGRSASPASDVFALGVVLYELVTGALPFAGGSPLETLMALSGGRYVDPRALAPELPDPVVAAITAALQRDPSDRPASPERLAQLALGDDAPAPAAPLVGTARARRAGAETAVTRTEGPSFTHFVGRAREVELLERTLAETRAGRPPLVIITGDAGLGKSRLAERLATAARRRGALVLAGRFYDYVGSRPPPLETFLAMIADRTRPASSDAPWAALDEVGAGQRWSAFAAIADALAGQAAGRPLVIVLDDLHCATRLDLELLDHVHRTLGPRGTLVVATARPSDAGPDFATWRNARAAELLELPLTGFGEAEVRAWMEGAFHGLDITPIQTRQLLRASGGNPFALVELARALVTRGELVQLGVGWRLELGDLPQPPSVAAMVVARVDELAPTHRAVLEYAAVLGDEFRAATVVAASGLTEAAVDDALDAGVGLRLLSEREVSVGNDLRFTSPLVRQCIYDRMPSRARRRIHRAVVDALAAIYGTTDDRFAHVFASHHQAIGAWPEAFDFAVRAAAEALTRGDLDLAHAAAAQADAAARELAALGQAGAPAAVARLERVAGTLATALGDPVGGAARLTRAIALAPTRELAIDAQIELARNLAARGELVASGDAALAAAAAAAAAGDRGRHLLARVAAADYRGRAGLVTLDVLDELVAECAAAVGDRPRTDLEARALLMRMLRHQKAGRFADAETDGRRARDLARANGLLEIELRVVASLSAIRSEAGDVAGSQRFAEQVLAMARRLGDRRREGIALANLGEGYVEAGDPGRGQQLLEDALRIFVAIGDRACEGDCRVNLGRAQLAGGRVEAAIATLTEAAAMCARSSRVEYEGIARMLLGEARRAKGEPAAARSDFAAAVELLGRIDHNNRWRADLGLAQTAADQGDPAAARAAAASAHAHLRALRARLAPGTSAERLDAALATATALLATLPTT